MIGSYTYFMINVGCAIREKVVYLNNLLSVLFFSILRIPKKMENLLSCSCTMSPVPVRKEKSHGDRDGDRVTDA